MDISNRKRERLATNCANNRHRNASRAQYFLVDTSVVSICCVGISQHKHGISLNVILVLAVRLEAIEGVQNRTSQRAALRLLNRFELVELTTQDMVWATNQLLKFNLSHNIDVFDCMIAAVNHRLQIPLYTRNLKHFLPLIDQLARAPF